MSRGGRGGHRSGLTFNAELLGINTSSRGGPGGDSLPTSVLTPPPKYPPLSSKPSPLLINPEQEYLLAVKKEYLNFLKSSPYFRGPPANSQTESGKLDLDWSRFPKELHPNASSGKKRKRPTDIKPKLIKRTGKDLDSKLDSLEAKEKGDPDDLNASKDENKEEEGSEDGDEKKEGGADSEAEEDEVDEEMDEGTDYANNFFDNGEDYLDEDDDNLDEGGIY